MRKSLLLFVMTLLVCSGIQAQIVSSRSVGIESTPQRPSETMWYLRGGLNMAGFAGDGTEGMGRKAAYNFAVGFQKPITNIGAYWGMDFGFTFGWKYGITDDFFIDGHIGGFISFDYLGKMKYDGESISMGDWEDELDIEWNRFDAGMNIGFGIWYDRFNLDFTFQRGFVEAATDSEAYTSNIMLRLGVAF